MSNLSFLENLKNHFLNKYKFVLIPESKITVQSSVSIVIRKINSKYEILFIKRTTKDSDKFSGHMAFPGGVREKVDKSSLATAIRETKEEIGLDLKLDCDILGRFSDYQPVNPEANKFIVSPFIFYLNKPDVELVRCEDEVEEIVWIPIDILLTNLTNSNRIGTRYEKPYKDNVFLYHGYKIWGMTGKMIYAFLHEIKNYHE
ncbi:CoA pyrophosphatase [bacterium]|jgi:8-oxo-dGTP pyrophosphatase MutT (NUDIX family)|nr:CoA pyrophosphatase [bacterium]MBT3795650.1 CoA pyrophosphatase [bacterium]MBT4634496.1 CoA pyrophosphatase [bacterium]